MSSPGPIACTPWLARLRLNDVALDDVADLDVVLVLEHDAALKSHGDLTSVVLHPPERPDLPVVDGGPATEKPYLRAATHETVDNPGTSDGRLARREDLQHLGVSEKRLDHLRLEHSGERLLHVVEQLVDDLVLANVDLRRLGDAPGRRFHLRVESDDDGVRSGREGEIRLGEIADGVGNDGGGAPLGRP